MSATTEIAYLRDFQITLVAQLAADPEFYHETEGYLRIQDFDLSTCQVIYEALRNCYQICNGAAPTLDLLQMQVVRIVTNTDGQAQTSILPEQREALALVMQTVAATMVRPEQVKRDYLKHFLQGYLKHIRTTKVLDAHANRLAMGQGADDFIQHIIAINQSIGAGTDLTRANLMEFTPEQQPLTSTVNTGLRLLNDAIGSGLGMGQQGMVTACPGVGKTTALINFMNGAVLSGNRSLFITLELSLSRIRRRYLAVATGIDIRYFNVPQERWPDAIRARLERYTNPNSPFFDYAEIVDGSTRRVTLDEVERAIVDWKRRMTDKYGAEQARCNAVFVDWLDCLNPQGSGVRMNQNTKDYEIVTKLNEQLGRIFRRHEVAGWTATQGTRDADGKEVMAMRHTAGAYHKNDALDVGLGLAEIRQRVSTRMRNVAADSTIYDDSGKIINLDAIGAPCQRSMMISITKNRDNPTTHFDIFQGRNLQFFNNRSEETELIKYLESDNITGAQHYLLTETARQITL